MIYSGDLNMGIRRYVQAVSFPNYNDRNDGFTRTCHSRNKWRNARITKQGKIVRTKAPHKLTINNIY